MQRLAPINQAGSIRLTPREAVVKQRDGLIGIVGVKEAMVHERGSLRSVLRRLREADEQIGTFGVGAVYAVIRFGDAERSAIAEVVTDLLEDQPFSP